MKWALIKMTSMHMRKICFISSSLSPNTQKKHLRIFFLISQKNIMEIHVKLNLYFIADVKC